MSRTDENDLYDLLDVKKQRNSVNFDDFVSFIGLDKDYSSVHQHTIDSYSKYKPVDQQHHTKRRDDVRYIMRLLIGQGIKVQ